MKTVSARATLSETGKNLFSTRETARETFKKVIEVRSNHSGTFKVGTVHIRTERPKNK